MVVDTKVSRCRIRRVKRRVSFAADVQTFGFICVPSSGKEEVTSPQFTQEKRIGQ